MSCAQSQILTLEIGENFMVGGGSSIWLLDTVSFSAILDSVSYFAGLLSSLKTKETKKFFLRQWS